MRTLTTGPAKGYLCVAAAAVLWASSGTASKALFDSGMTPFELVQVRVTLSSVIVLAALAIRDRRLLRIRPRDIPYFAVLGGVGMALLQVMYFYAISKIQVAAAILIQDTAPILVAVFAMLFWNERFSKLKLAALVLAFGGCYLTIGGYSIHLLQANRLGLLGGLAAAFSFAGYTLLAERAMHRYTPWTVIFYAFVFAALSFHVFYPPFRYLFAGYSPAQWGAILYIVVAGTVISYGLYAVGISRIRSTRAIITALLEPVASGFMAFFLLGEVLQPLQILGGGAVIGAVVLLQFEREHDELTPERIRAARAGRT